MIQDQTLDRNFWKPCSSCKKEIPFSAKYQICSVSTCHSKRKGFVFCSIECWDAHLGFANHREASAQEEQAPSHNTPDQQPARKKIIVPPTQSNKKTSPSSTVDTLVVVSKIKNFIRDQSGYNTSQCAIDALTQRVVDECLKAIEKAHMSGRKTVMGRDVV